MAGKKKWIDYYSVCCEVYKIPPMNPQVFGPWVHFFTYPSITSLGSDHKCTNVNPPAVQKPHKKHYNSVLMHNSTNS